MVVGSAIQESVNERLTFAAAFGDWTSQVKLHPAPQEIIQEFEVNFFFTQISSKNSAIALKRFSIHNRADD
ncbi:hypothetical protein StoSoilA2_34210 [Arthrobacter sp. StoSoilA2]|nr:hypothetical protein StoSoilA2_34210 [Arthrobacter sp. StoSoilA2]